MQQGGKALIMAWSRARFYHICELTLKERIPLSIYSYPQRNVLVSGVGFQGVKLAPGIGFRGLIAIRQEH